MIVCYAPENRHLKKVIGKAKQQHFHLQNEWNDCFTLLWIVFEFIFVVSVFSERPYGHLIETGKCKDEGRHAVCHDRKEDP